MSTYRFSFLPPTFFVRFCSDPIVSLSRHKPSFTQNSFDLKMCRVVHCQDVRADGGQRIKIARRDQSLTIFAICGSFVVSRSETGRLVSCVPLKHQ